MPSTILQKRGVARVFKQAIANDGIGTDEKNNGPDVLDIFHYIGEMVVGSQLHTFQVAYIKMSIC